MKKEMFDSKFGIEIELTGITREEAAKVVADTVGGRIEYIRDNYDRRNIIQPDGRKWSIVYDGSIIKKKRNNRIQISAGYEYSVELVSPILTYYEDIDTLQQIVRNLRQAGGFANKDTQCGIHIHLDGEPHNAKTLRNFII